MIKIPDNNFDPVKYLVARKFPYYADNSSFRLRMLPRPTMDGQIPRLLIAQYQKELVNKPADEITTLVEAEKEIERQELITYEAQQWFNGANCQADFDYWCKASFWTLEEAMVLTLAKEPRKVTWDSVKSEKRHSPFVQEYEKRLELGRRAEITVHLHRHNRPFNFLIWAKDIDLSYPPELEVVVSRASDAHVDWKTRFDDEAAAHAATKLVADDLRAKLTVFEGKPLPVRERESLLKIIIGIAVHEYGYNPKSNRSPIAKEIAGILEQRGIGLDEDTVRKFLQEARELLPPEGAGRP